MRDIAFVMFPLTLYSQVGYVWVSQRILLHKPIGLYILFAICKYMHVIFKYFTAMFWQVYQLSGLVIICIPFGLGQIRLNHHHYHIFVGGGGYSTRFHVWRTSRFFRVVLGLLSMLQLASFLFLGYIDVSHKIMQDSILFAPVLNKEIPRRKLFASAK